MDVKHHFQASVMSHESVILVLRTLEYLINHLQTLSNEVISSTP